MESDTRTSKVSLVLGIAGAATCALGPLLAQLSLVPPMVAFVIFAVGLLDCLLALPLGAVAMWQTRAATGRSGRGRAAAGIALGAIPLAVVFAAVGSTGDVPRINDITTDPDDPPKFSAAQMQDANTGRDLGYPGAAFAAAQRAAYPDVEPMRLRGTTGEVLDRCAAAAKGLGWQITQRDPATGTFEAIDVSSAFRFVDDIVVRVRPDGSEVVIDVRSKSRDGKSDLGANAARIRAFREAL